MPLAQYTNAEHFDFILFRYKRNKGTKKCLRSAFESAWLCRGDAYMQPSSLQLKIKHKIMHPIFLPSSAPHPMQQRHLCMHLDISFVINIKLSTEVNLLLRRCTMSIHRNNDMFDSFFCVACTHGRSAMLKRSREASGTKQISPAASQRSALPS